MRFRFGLITIMLAALVGGWYLATHYAAQHAGMWLNEAGKVWSASHPASYGFVKTNLQQGPISWLWDQGIAKVLVLPLGIIVGLALIFVVALLTRRSRRVPESVDDAYGLPAQPPPGGKAPRSELAEALRACRTAFIGIGVFSGMSNILMLTGAFYMLQCLFPLRFDPGFSLRSDPG